MEGKDAAKEVGLCSLPAEIRVKIYEHYFRDVKVTVHLRPFCIAGRCAIVFPATDCAPASRHPCLALLEVSKQFRAESTPIFFGEATFHIPRMAVVGNFIPQHLLAAMRKFSGTFSMMYYAGIPNYPQIGFRTNAQSMLANMKELHVLMKVSFDFDSTSWFDNVRQIRNLMAVGRFARMRKTFQFNITCKVEFVNSIGFVFTIDADRRMVVYQPKSFNSSIKDQRIVASTAGLLMFPAGQYLIVSRDS